MVNSIHGNSSYSQSVFRFVDLSRGAWNPGHPRVFKDLDGEEHGALKFILENLSQKSLLRLMTLQGKLRENGDRLEHIHPLAFFMGILQHNNLRDYYYDLRNKDNKAWREFYNGAIKSFVEEKQGGNIQDHHIELFCQRVGKDPNYIRHLMHTENWHEFLKHI